MSAWHRLTSLLVALTLAACEPQPAAVAPLRYSSAWRLFQQEHPTEAAQLMAIWETPHLINNSVMVRDDVPAAVREPVTQALFALTQTPQGQAILQGIGTASFTPASDASYAPVADFIQRFEQEVRPVEGP